jgi:hypothetical protein
MAVAGKQHKYQAFHPHKSQGLMKGLMKTIAFSFSSSDYPPNFYKKIFPPN